MVLLAAFLFVAPAVGQTRAKAHLRTITRLEQIRRMTPEEAGRGYPVKVRAVVTYDNWRARDLFIQDASAGIWVEPGKSKPNVHVGELVEVDGISAAGDLSSEIHHAQFRPLGEAPMPRPRRPTSDELASGSDDSQWIELQGVVRSAAERNGGLAMNLSSGAFACRVFVLNYPSPPPDVIDARVRVRGVFSGLYDTSTSSRFVGFQVLTPSWDHVQILQRPSRGPLSLPVRPLVWFLRLTSDGAFAHRVHVRGIVLLQRLGQFVAIRDHGETLWVTTSQRLPLKAGDLIDAVGFPAIGDYTPVMRDAVIQRISSGPAPDAIPADARDLQAGGHDADLVRLSARLLNYTTRPGEKVLELQSGQVTFRAELETGTQAAMLESLRTGSLLRLTGVCRIEADENRDARNFRLLLRSAEDVVVLKTPSWWTVKKALLLLGLLAIAILAACGWVVILRRRVRHQTRLIAERYKKEQVLEERYRDLFENANDAILVYDPEGNITACNKAAEFLSGYSREEILSMKAKDIVAPECVKQSERMMARRLEGEERTTLQINFMAKDGRRVPVEISTRLVRQDNKMVGVYGAARDITDRKRAEAEMLRAKEAAEAANRAKSEFVANMSHEIRTPMNGVLGMVELLLDTDLTSEQRDYLGMVKGSADSLLMVINDVLDFSKIEAGKMELEAIDFSVRGSLEAALKTLALRAREKGLELNCNVSREIPETLVGDPVRLCQILINLTGNALKFTHKGEVNVRVEKESVEEDCIWLHIAVQDTGVGIPREKQGKIFESFTQADGSTTRRYGGTGLGLTISKQLVKMLGGCIWVESTLGEGSTFHFTCRFGIAKVEPPVGATQTAGLEGPRVPMVEKPLRVLLVEDNEVNQKLALRLLENRGHSVAVADNGNAALSRLDEECFDLVLMDVQMPEMDGLEATAAIRAKERLSGERLPIIAITAHAMQGDRERCLAAGMDGYLTKPIQPRELFECMQAVAIQKLALLSRARQQVVGAPEYASS